MEHREWRLCGLSDPLLGSEFDCITDTMNKEVTYHILGPDNAWQLEGSNVFDNSVDPEQLTAFIADTGHEMVFASIDAKTVGIAFGNVQLHPDKPPSFYIDEVGVNEEFRRRGIAISLCERLMKVARDRGCHGIWLATENDNTEARALYRTLNARETNDVVIYELDEARDD